jgi:aminodeoxyfutalosine synthase
MNQWVKKIERGHRFNFSEGLALYEWPDIFQLGIWADQILTLKNGQNVSYNVNRHINYTNICLNDCRFCEFSRHPNENNAYVIDIEEVTKIAFEAYTRGADEVHIVGGINPDLPYHYYVEIIRQIRRQCPKIRIKAFTAVEILHLSRLSERPIESILTHLMDIGLDSMPGGGAEVLDEAFHRKYCSRKPGPEEWLEVHAAAHRLGLNTNATMLYGCGENPLQAINHMIRLRQLQDDSLDRGRGTFQCFVPLPFVGPGKMASELSLSSHQMPNIVRDLKILAISRLMLDNFDHIKAFWPLMGVRTAQIGLCFGADDLDGTVGDYRIARGGGVGHSYHLAEQDIRNMISAVGKIPVRRSGIKKDGIPMDAARKGG